MGNKFANALVALQPELRRRKLVLDTGVERSLADISAADVSHRGGDAYVRAQLDAVRNKAFCESF